MDQSMRPYVETYPVRRTLTNESEGLLQEGRILKKTTKSSKDSNLIKRGKTWTCIVYVYDPAKGKKKPKWYGGFRTKGEAKAARIKLQAEADALGLYATDLTFKQYVEMYMKLHEGHFRPGTIKYYNRVLVYTKAIDDKAMKDIKAEDIARVHETLKAAGTLSPPTVYKYLVQVKVIFNFAEKRGDISVNPYNRFVMPPNKPVKHHAPTNAIITEMIQKSEGSFIYLPIIFAVMLGLRRGEVFGLQYEDFDFDKATVSIKRQITNCAITGNDFQPSELKTESSYRTLKVPESLLALVKKRHEEHPDHSWLFAKEDGERYSPTSIMKYYEEFCKKNGYKVRFHDLRHAYGTICLNNRIPMKAISDTMGHHNIEVTSNIYCDTRELLDAPADLMEETFGALLK